MAAAQSSRSRGGKAQRFNPAERDRSHTLEALNHRPFGNGILPADGADAVHVRQLMMQIIGEMAARGYRALASSEISKKENETDTIFFVRTGVVQAPAARAAVMLAMRDTIRLINGPPELQQVFQVGTSIICDGNAFVPQESSDDLADRQRSSPAGLDRCRKSSSTTARIASS